jgi:hypothetical protein
LSLFILELLFDDLAVVNPTADLSGADESALIERIAELERIKSAAAAGQARAAAALDTARRVAEAGANRSHEATKPRSHEATKREHPRDLDGGLVVATVFGTLVL